MDNASSDGSVGIAERLADEHEPVRLLRSPTNRGYAGAVNLALPEARGEQIAVLNMDVVVGRGWLDPLIALLDSNPAAGVACPLILLESDPGRINAAGQNLNKTGLGFNRWLGEPRESAGTTPFEVTGLHGAAFVIGKSLVERLGGWDESGFLYFEDVELSWLLRIAGAEIWCVPASTVTHDYHLTMFPHKLFLLERNRWKMLLADLRGRTRLALSPLLALTELMMWGYCLLRGPKFLQGEGPELPLGEGEPGADRTAARAGRLGSPPLRPRRAARPALGLSARSVPDARARARALPKGPLRHESRP